MRQVPAVNGTIFGPHSFNLSLRAWPRCAPGSSPPEFSSAFGREDV
jgi:hypothetical protein